MFAHSIRTGRRRLGRAGPPRHHHRRARGGGQGAAPRRAREVHARHRYVRMGRCAPRSAGRRGQPPAPAPGHRQFQALDRARAGLAARSRLRLRAGRTDARLRRLPHPRDRLGPHQRPGDDARLDRRHQDQRQRRARRRWPRSQGTGQPAGARLPQPGDQRRLLPCRHAPGQPVRRSRRDHRGDRFRHHGPHRPARPRLARRNPLWPHHRQLPPRGRDPFRGAIRAELPFGRRIRDRAARGGRTDARQAGQRAFGGPDARRAVRDHPRFRHADPAAPAAAAEIDGHGRRHRHPARSRNQHVGYRRAVRAQLDSRRTRPRIRDRRPHPRGCGNAAAPARAGAPDRGPLPRQGRRARTAAAARRGIDVGTQARRILRRLGGLCAGLRGGRRQALQRARFLAPARGGGGAVLALPALLRAAGRIRLPRPALGGGAALPRARLALRLRPYRRAVFLGRLGLRLRARLSGRYPGARALLAGARGPAVAAAPADADARGGAAGGLCGAS
ncbi:hypothetical protein Lal_00008336, partial [Lupinus albus]